MTKYEDKIEQIKDILDNLDLDELIGYCPCLDGDDAIYPMSSFDDIGIEEYKPLSQAKIIELYLLLYSAG